MARTTPRSETIAAAWDLHRELRKKANIAIAMCDGAGSEELTVLNAREAAAKRFPGCATAILSPNADINWDRGRVIADELAKQRERR